MSKDLKGYLKNNKNSKITREQSENAQNMASELSKKSIGELSKDFQTALATAKANGTFDKDEMLSMLSGIKGNMSNAEFARIKSIIANL